MGAGPVRYDSGGGVARIVLARPQVLNALNTPLAAALADAVERAARDPEVAVVVVGGEGTSFSSGMDRTALSAGQTGEVFFRHWIRALNGLEDMAKPVLAAIHGYCIGGGLQLALAGDFRLATRDAVLGLGATRHGLIPDGAVLRLARTVGIGRAKELALLNDQISAEEARAMGLVNWIVPPEEFEAGVGRIVAKCLEAAPTALGHTKRLLHESFHVDPRSVIEEVVEAQKECLASWEIEEANQAWDERREARFHPGPSRGSGPRA